MHTENERSLVVGLFVEGSRPTDPLRDDFNKMWHLLAKHCGCPVDLHVVGISKGHIVRLQPNRPAGIPAKAGATQLVRGQTQLVGGGDPLDVAIARLLAEVVLDRVIIAFDMWKPNQLLTLVEQQIGCPMRPEVAFVLRHLAASKRLDVRFRSSAQALLVRYSSNERLRPRATPPGALEVIFMDPSFEAIFVADERTVKKALGVSKRRPKDWPKFRTHERDLGRAILDRALGAAKGLRNGYTQAKSRWGHELVKAAASDAKLWDHEIIRRLRRFLAP